MRAQITTTTDRDGKEWVHVERLRYYLYQRPETALWCVMNCNPDFAVTKGYKIKREGLQPFVATGVFIKAGYHVIAEGTGTIPCFVITIAMTRGGVIMHRRSQESVLLPPEYS
ncbi:MAG: hypothetical protein QOI07_3223 [Verrucomicrobiota bacterium]|jgi:hypothetical protein